MGTDDRIKDLHKVDLKGLIIVYGGLKSIFTSLLFWLSLGFSTIFSIILIFISSNEQLLNIISKTCDIGLGIEGGLVGLSLAGLTLVITFGGASLINTIIDQAVEDFIEKNEVAFSIYQTTISKFGYAVLIQIISLFILFMIRVCFDLQVAIPAQTAIIINVLIIYLVFFFISYSFLLVIQMTLNVFTLGQMNHFTLFMEKLRALKKVNKSNSPEE